MTRPSENPYLAGNFAPLTDEVTAFDLPVQGTIPAELDGRFLRNGPNPLDADPATYHWFLGTGMVHGVRLRGGRAEWYRSRFVRAGSILDRMGWEDPGGPEGVMVSAVNTNVIGHAGKTLACVEAGAYPIELTDELETIGRTDLADAPGRGLTGPFSAHPKRDPDSGELHVAAYWFGFDDIQYQVIGADGTLSHLAEIPVPGKPMMHDVSITDSRVVLYDLPVTFNIDAAMSGAPLPYRWDPDYGARIGVLPKRGTAADVVWYDVEPCFVFHPMNAYDLPDGRLVIDVVRHPSMFRTDLRGPNEGPSTLCRWTVDPPGGKVIEEQLDDHPVEFPRVDERLVGKRARYGYGARFAPGGGGVGLEFGPLYRYDFDTATAAQHDFGPGRVSFEPVFVPRRDDAAEDDGWILTFVYDAAEDSSELVILDAQGFGDDPVATVRLPNRIPFGFHGNWVPTGA